MTPMRRERRHWKNHIDGANGRRRSSPSPVVTFHSRRDQNEYTKKWLEEVELSKERAKEVKSRTISSRCWSLPFGDPLCHGGHHLEAEQAGERSSSSAAAPDLPVMEGPLEEAGRCGLG